MENKNGFAVHVGMITHAYLGLKQCGCAVAVVVDTPDDPKFVAQTLSEFLADGYKIDHVTLEESGRRLVKNCKHGKIKKLVTQVPDPSKDEPGCK